MPRTPMFSEPLHVGRPNVGDRARLLERINGALDRLWLSNNGPLVQELEERVASITGARHCVAVANATTGIQLAARACGIRQGQEVIVPAFTWIASPHALEWAGLVPVFCDVDEETATADPQSVEELIGPRTGGILGVHVYGRPCRVTELAKVAERHGLPLLFDAAHAFGSTYQQQPLGGFGSAEIFSFHATKYINSFEGGALVTNDDEVAERVRAMRNLGLSPDRDIVSAGTNGRMSEISAAMGLVSMDIMDDLIEVNMRNERWYREGLAGLPGVTVRAQAPKERANHQYLVLEIDAALSGVHRDTVHETLYAHNVYSRRYFYPGCHQSEPYVRDPAVHAPVPLPHTEALSARALALPTGSAVGEAEVAGVCEIIRATVTA
ncbi:MULTISPECIES: DegT/DnrJ/EryC1/StrS family aminotransferase [unclassified Streptomyces]|uniref:DegT/DnrJ/EryC1/StrS family aminotransferase n=1 Tax=unclassified Streptomyces TaxID=2593676 RepID=UPI002DDC8854|nr:MULTISPECIES: DegT/DnrJ/EryC1/StrS family aminotransferase [unclassified Streptomyces]WSA95910.1 aminotransferase class I/II-fold pyridoxal phosphate-dependent enzyme [Streptomyces sp. NBC_01795]WSB80325.1 aminotransferase class I/II-fold pyridoxal phosphate-dependent enzyme [Streptomyces sp. NBC_01775]WSS11464.1 aminotransferase class I/II-fold pyridoxal phosphate-dependent enzyme [Streptomyces sp. NBC_01186]WSS40178.1 aminotransferase class I/II-fold pyridoxal phosphate-dependent enzyme [S